MVNEDDLFYIELPAALAEAFIAKLYNDAEVLDSGIQIELHAMEFNGPINVIVIEGLE